MLGFASRFSTLIVVWIFFLSEMIGQTLDHIQGEFIVQVQNDANITDFQQQQNIKALRKSNDVTFRQIMKTPLNLWVVKIDFASVSESEFETRLQSAGGFVHVKPNRRITPRTIPNDPDLTKQWQYINYGLSGGVADADMDMEQAWDIATGGLTPSGDTIVVCVIDDGINGLHEDIKENLWFNHQEIASNGIDDDGNGYVDDVRGWNITNSDDNTYSGGGHGTPVAGIVGAKGNNGVGVSGVNWNVKLMIVNYGFASEANALASYGYAYTMRKLYNETNGQKGAFVVVTNASWGIDRVNADDAPLWCALYDELGQVGILNCGATTNSDTDVDIQGDLPTSCTSEYLITVTNLNKSDTKLTSAGYGRKSLDLGAYGHQTYTLTRSAYGTFGGTSGATPHVSGVVALMYSVPCNSFATLTKQNPAGAALVAKDMLLNGVIPNASLTGITTTGGKLNAFRAVSNLKKMCESCSPPAGIALKMEDQALHISWINQTGTAKVALRYRKTDSNVWKEIKNIFNNKVIDGLDYCTEYEIQWSSDCGFLPSEYSYSKFVTTTGCCASPQISVTDMDDQSIHLTWSASDTAIYTLQYKSAAFDWQDTILTSTAFSIFKLTECTGYTFRLKAECLKYNNESTFTPDYNISTSCGNCTAMSYCSFTKKDASQEWIESFEIAGVKNVSGTSDDGYRNFAGVENITLETKANYPFVLKTGYAGTAFKDYFKIFIDYNQDGEWSENEQVYQSPGSLSETVTDTIAIPEDASAGYTKLRLIMAYEEFEGGCDNASFEYGEVEDYCVYIQNKECNNPSIQAVGSSKSDLLFIVENSSQGSQDSVRVKIREKGVSEWAEYSGVDTLVISQLKECTLYEYTFRKICGTFFSAPSAIDTIRTGCKNSVYDVIEAVVISPNPASDILNIRMIQPSAKVLRIQVADITGRKFYNEFMKESRSDISVDISNVPAGMYMVEVAYVNGKKRVYKFIKN